MAKFDSKSFNPQAFGKYVDRVPNPKKKELAKSGAIGSNEQAREALSSQTGSLYCRVPYYGTISGKTSQNNTGATDIVSSNTTTFEQGFIVASRMDGWTERSFSKNITAGVDFMNNVAEQIADYKLDVKQDIILAILKGIYSMSTSGSTVAAKAAKTFIDKHTYDITANEGEDAYVGAKTLNSAMQKACGDNKDIFKLVIMDSTIATNLENLQLLKYFTYTDKDGLTRELALGSWNGRAVLVDDGMPTEDIPAVKADESKGIKAVEAYTKHTSYVLGLGSIICDDIGDSVPFVTTYFFEPIPYFVSLSHTSPSTPSLSFLCLRYTNEKIQPYTSYNIPRLLLAHLTDRNRLKATGRLPAGTVK